MAAKQDKDLKDKKQTKAKKGGKAPLGELARSERYDFTYTQNRELSWLRFDDRVLSEAYDESVPLFERLKFAAIFQSNLDEFFMIRIGGLSDLATLKHQPVDNKSNLTPSEQIDRVFQALPPLVKRQNDIVHTIESELEHHGVFRLTADELAGADRTFTERYFQSYVSPVISPLVIDPRHPFPNLRNGALYIVCALESADEENLLGLIEVPSSMNRVVALPADEGTYRYMLLEDVILTCLGSCFGSYEPLDRAVVRVTRNADIDPDGEGVEEDEDYRQHMKKILKKRLRLQPVALQVEGALEPATLKSIRKSLGLAGRAVLTYTTPLDLDYVYGIEGHLPEHSKAALVFNPFRPQASPMFTAGRPLREQVIEGDKLLFYPYESMNPLLDLMHEAAFDDDCISMKITLYRVAKQSRLCEALIDAAENGKEVTVLMELRARFDEQNNIEWAERLEEAGCTVIYGAEGFKVHSKICQITYREGMALTRITLLGTGNFNEKTARLYSDFMLMTAHPGIGEDANAFFRNLALGNLRGDYRYLGVAPAGLKPLIMNGLNREIERALAGEPARVFFKMNSLTDREIIDKIAEASQAGVVVDMIIRGISCLVPGIPGKTENVHIRSIVGRFLEHARVYAFGVENDIVYLSSADMMTRNTEHRVEIAYPVLDPTCRALVESYMQAQLRDNVKARTLSTEGAWESVPRAGGEADFNAQEFLLAEAYRRAAHPKRAMAEVRAEAGAPAPKADGDQAAAPAEPTVDETAADENARTAFETALAETEARAHAAEAAVTAETAVAAELIEPAAGNAAPEEAPAAAEAKQPAEAPAEGTARTTLAKRPAGRLRTGLALIGLGIRTLVRGTKTK
ncbi:polyphosphate kinase 1 [Collinsella sp. An307]|uniref:polyphosphate kinase 1 n=1 Tax=Collinsella sp. An307 TaxID=1965630 RepID=UPI000B38A6D1|nr:polyphosphate kinase 1 [Collinsella sp. An307]OUO22461.1 polyphosphate kinase 1 [Collinsella sp. An307]